MYYLLHYTQTDHVSADRLSSCITHRQTMSPQTDCLLALHTDRPCLSRQTVFFTTHRQTMSRQTDCLLALHTDRPCLSRQTVFLHYTQTDHVSADRLSSCITHRQTMSQQTDCLLALHADRPCLSRQTVFFTTHRQTMSPQTDCLLALHTDRPCLSRQTVFLHYTQTDHVSADRLSSCITHRQTMS